MADDPHNVHRPDWEKRWCPVIEVAFDQHGVTMFWSMPLDLSSNLVATMQEQEHKEERWIVGYAWSWGVPGEKRARNQYTVDFKRMVQTNVETGVERTIRIVYILVANSVGQATADRLVM